MSSIRKRKSNSTGAYKKILGNKQLDKLISKVHATTISALMHLEKLILELTNLYIIDNLDKLNKILNNEKIENYQTYLIHKKISPS